jgi:hypothetical protein
MTNPVLQTALTLLHAGLSPIPIGANKRPAIASWKCYQTAPDTQGVDRVGGLQALRARDRPGTSEWERRGDRCGRPLGLAPLV